MTLVVSCLVRRPIEGLFRQQLDGQLDAKTLDYNPSEIQIRVNLMPARKSISSFRTISIIIIKCSNNDK